MHGRKLPVDRSHFVPTDCLDRTPTRVMTHRTWRLCLLAIVGVALCLRLTYVITVVGDDALAGDAIYYSAQAETITRGTGFAHPFTGEAAADHPPATAVLLALPSIGGGDPAFEQRMFMALLGTMAVVAVAFLGREVARSLSTDPRVVRVGSLIVASAAALHPGFWINDGLAMSETPTTLITALVLIAAFRWRRGDGSAWTLGVLGGLAVLTRAELGLLMALLVMPVGLPWAWPRRLRQIMIVTIVALMTVAPWTIRNVVRFEEPVLVSTNDGLTLRGANCDPAYFEGVGFWYLQCAGPVEGDQSEVSSEYRRQAVDYVGDNLDRLPAVVGARLARVWSVWEVDAMTHLNQGEGRPPTASWLAVVGWWLLAPAAAGAILILRRRDRPVLVLVAPFVTVTAVAIATYGIPRFRLPAEVAAVGALAVYGVVSAERSWGRATPTPTPLPLPPHGSRPAEE